MVCGTPDGRFRRVDAISPATYDQVAFPLARKADLNGAD
jgi:hypothetical protein